MALCGSEIRELREARLHQILQAGGQVPVAAIEELTWEHVEDACGAGVEELRNRQWNQRVTSGRSSIQRSSSRSFETSSACWPGAEPGVGRIAADPRAWIGHCSGSTGRVSSEPVLTSKRPMLGIDCD